MIRVKRELMSGVFMPSTRTHFSSRANWKHRLTSDSILNLSTWFLASGF